MLDLLAFDRAKFSVQVSLINLLRVVLGIVPTELRESVNLPF
ncbi:hypothetical protein [Fibrella forsythiae]|nr:hypothetical protein [Fibrella forsythiae]